MIKKIGSGDYQAAIDNGVLSKKLADSRANPLMSKIIESKRNAGGVSLQSGSDSDRYQRPLLDNIHLRSEKIKVDLQVSKYRADYTKQRPDSGKLDNCLSPKSQQKFSDLIEQNTILEKLLARIQTSDHLDINEYEKIKSELFYSSANDQASEAVDEKSAFKILDLERLLQEQDHLIELEATLVATLENLKKSHNEKYNTRSGLEGQTINKA